MLGSGAQRDGLPQASYAYTPSASPDTWRLPYLAADGSPDPALLTVAAAQITDEGWQGARVQVPTTVLPAVKAKLRQAYRRSGRGETEWPEAIRETAQDVDTMWALAMGELGLRESIDDDLDAALDRALSEQDEAAMDRAIDAMLREAAADDHFYGPWLGGPKSQGGGPGDTEKRFAKGGVWDPERAAAVHKPYLDSVTKGVATVSEPVVHMTGGGPASGKSSGLLNNPATGIPGHGQAVHTDPDLAKMGSTGKDDHRGVPAIPEYAKASKAGYKGAAGMVHEESSYMANTAVSRALAGKQSAVYDTVGDNGAAKVASKVAKFRKQGATRVYGDYATCSVSEALRRNDVRFRETGRYVHKGLIRNKHIDVSKTFQELSTTATFDRLRLWDTNGPKPRLIAEKTGGGVLKIHDPGAWAAFVATGRMTPAKLPKSLRQ